MNNNYFWRVSIIVCVCILMMACSNRQENTIQNGKIIIFVSIAIEKSFVEAVAGDLVEVVSLVPNNASPESYQMTPRQLDLFSKASIYFAIGLPSEYERVFPKINSLNSEIKIIHLDQETSKIYPDIYFDDNNLYRDHHIWMSPKRVMVMVDTIKEELIELDPINKEKYLEQSECYMEKLKILDELVQVNLRMLQHDDFLINHPSLGYFADDYGLNMISIEQNGKKVTPFKLNLLIKEIKRKGIKSIFYQVQEGETEAKMIAKEIGGKAIPITVLSENYIENIMDITTKLLDSEIEVETDD